MSAKTVVHTETSTQTFTAEELIKEFDNSVMKGANDFREELMGIQSRLIQALRHADTENQSMKGQLSQSQSMRDIHQREIAQLRAELEKKNRELSEQNQNRRLYEGLQEKLKGQEGQIKLLTSQNISLKTDNQELHLSLDKERNTREGDAARALQAQQELQEITLRNQALVKEIDALRLKLSSLENAHHLENETQAELNKQKDKLKKELDTLKAKMADTTTDLSNQTNRIKEFETEIANLKSKNQNLEFNLKSQRNAYLETKDLLDKEKRLHGETKAREGTLIEQLRNREDTLSTRNQELLNAKNEILQLNVQIASKDAVNRQAANDLGINRSKWDTDRSEYEYKIQELRATMQTNKDRAEEDKKLLRHVITGRDGEIETLKIESLNFKTTLLEAHQERDALNHTVQDLKVQLTNLDAKYNKLVDENRSSLRRLTADLTEARTAIEKKTDENSRLSAQIQDFIIAKADLEGQKTRLVKENTDLIEDKTKLLQQIEKYEKKWNDNESQIHSLTVHSENLRIQLAEETNARVALETSVANLLNEVEQRKKDIIRLHTNTEELTHQLENAKLAMSQSASDRDKYRSLYDAIATEYEKARKQLAVLETERLDLAEDNSRLASDLFTVRQHNAGLQKKVEELRQQLEETNEQREIATTQASHWRNEHRLLARELQEVKNALQHAQGVVQSKELRIQELLKRIKDLEGKSPENMTEIKLKLSIAQAQAEEANHQRQDLAQQLIDARTKLDALSDRDAIKAELDDIRAKYQDLLQKYNQETAKHNEQYQRLIKELAAARDTIKTLEAENAKRAKEDGARISSLENQLAKITSDLSHANARVLSLRDDLNKRAKELEDAKNTVVDLGGARSSIQNLLHEKDARIEELETLARSKGIEIDSATHDRDSHKSHKDLLQSEHEKLVEKYAHLEKQIIDLNAQIDGLKTALYNARNELESLRKEKDTWNEERDSLNAEIARQTSNNKSLQDSMNDLNTKLSARDAEIAKERAESEKFKRLATDATDNYNQAAKKVKEIEQHLRSVLSELGNYKAQTQTLTKRIEEISKSEEVAKASLVSVRTEKDKYKREAELYSNNCMALKSGMETWKTELHLARSKVSEHINISEHSKKELERALAEANELRKKYEGEAANAAKLENERTHLLAENISLTQNVEKLHKDNRAQLNKTESPKPDARVHELNRQLVELRQRLEAAERQRKEAQEASEKATVLRDQFAKLQAERNEAQARNKDFENRASNQSKELEQLRHDLKESSVRVRLLEDQIRDNLHGLKEEMRTKFSLTTTTSVTVTDQSMMEKAREYDNLYARFHDERSRLYKLLLEEQDKRQKAETELKRWMLPQRRRVIRLREDALALPGIPVPTDGDSSSDESGENKNKRKRDESSKEMTPRRRRRLSETGIIVEIPWQTYIDSDITSKGHASKAAIFSADCTHLARSSGFAIDKEQVKAAIDAFSRTSASLPLTIGDQRFEITEATKYSLTGKQEKNGNQACVIRRGRKAIILAICEPERLSACQETIRAISEEIDTDQ